MNSPSVSSPPIAERITYNCPKCGSSRVHRSRRHSAIDHLLSQLGGTLRRCHDCRSRHAWYGLYPVPLANSTGARLAARSLAAFVAMGLIALGWMFVRNRLGAG